MNNYAVKNFSDGVGRLSRALLGGGGNNNSDLVRDLQLEKLAQGVSSGRQEQQQQFQQQQALGSLGQAFSGLNPQEYTYARNADNVAFDGLNDQYQTPEWQQKIGDSQLFQSLASAGGGDVSQLVKALGGFDDRNTRRDITGGNFTGDLSNAMSLLGAKPIFEQNASGQVLNQFTGGVGDVGELLQSIIGKNDAQALKAQRAPDPKASTSLSSTFAKMFNSPVLDEQNKPIIDEYGQVYRPDQDKLARFHQFYAENRAQFPDINTAYLAWQEIDNQSNVVEEMPIAEKAQALKDARLAFETDQRNKPEIIRTLQGIGIDIPQNLFE